jgi:hypothetical protein
MREMVGDGVDVDVDLDEEKKEESGGDGKGVVIDPRVIISSCGIVISVSRLLTGFESE